jgi:hypothetical protein
LARELNIFISTQRYSQVTSDNTKSSQPEEKGSADRLARERKHEKQHVLAAYVECYSLAVSTIQQTGDIYTGIFRHACMV